MKLDCFDSGFPTLDAQEAQASTERATPRKLVQIYLFCMTVSQSFFQINLSELPTKTVATLDALKGKFANSWPVL